LKRPKCPHISVENRLGRGFASIPAMSAWIGRGDIRPMREFRRSTCAGHGNLRRIAPFPDRGARAAAPSGRHHRGPSTAIQCRANRAIRKALREKGGPAQTLGTVYHRGILARVTQVGPARKLFDHAGAPDCVAARLAGIAGRPRPRRGEPGLERGRSAEPPPIDVRTQSLACPDRRRLFG